MLLVRGDQGHRQTYGCNEDWGSHILSKLSKDWKIEHSGGVVFLYFGKIYNIGILSLFEILELFRILNNFNIRTLFLVRPHVFKLSSICSKRSTVFDILKKNGRISKHVQYVWSDQHYWSDIEALPMYSIFWIITKPIDFVIFLMFLKPSQ